VAAASTEATAGEDADAIARERADLAARAGLGDPGPIPEQAAPGAERAEPERAQIVVDRSELLRMFSGLKDD
jgi:hypothetical protein